ncbi:MAG: hypothetical protein JSW60_06065 [Thermoplasmatales archaeon]|nr:MAG: hypothetical protein JSW60_06065 [Thermoplasmatales archaeon]
MKKKIIGIFVCTLLIATVVPVTGSLGGFQLYDVSSYGKINNSEWANCIDEGLDGGYVVANYNYSGYNRESKFHVFKTDENGSIVWHYKELISGHEAVATCVKTTSDNHYVAGGYYWWEDEYHGWLSVRIVVIKLTSDGDLVWEKHFGSLYCQNKVYDIEECENGSYIVAGCAGFTNEEFWNTHISLLWISQDGEQSKHQKKINFEEEVEWPIGYDRALAVKQTSDGNYIVTGVCIRLWVIPPYPPELISVPRCFITKVYSNLDPDPIWFEIFGDEAPERAARGYDIEIANDGGYIVCGEYWEDYNESIPDRRTSNAWLLKTDDNGNSEWGDYGIIYGDYNYSCLEAGVSIHGDNHYVAGGWGDIPPYGFKIYMIRVDLNGNLVAEGELGDYHDIPFSLKHIIGRKFVIAGVTDNGYDADTLIAHVRHTGNVPPEAPTIDGETTGPEDYELNFTFCSTDSDVDLLEYIVDWGDGTGEELIPGPFESGEVVTASHSWSEPETYEIRAKARDLYPEGYPGEESEWSDPWPVDIFANIPPYAPTIDGPRFPIAGRPTKYTFTTIDPDGNDIYLYIKWGDCTTEEWIGPFESGQEVDVWHTYTKKWRFCLIQAQAKDIYGKIGDWGQRIVFVLGFYNHGCPAGTQITMAMGSLELTKSIEDIIVGDYIQSYDPVRQILVPAEVIETYEFSEGPPENRFIFNGNLEVTTKHTMYINQTEWKEASDTVLFDLMLENQPGSPTTTAVPITSKEPSTGPAGPIYDLAIQPPEGNASGYFANGILVGGYD